MKSFAVVTPTYNRSRFLIRLYESLKKQTFSYEDFDWIVVDDGSKDDTREVLNSLVDDSPFQIIYLYKENGGKHSAWRHAVKYLKDTDYEYFVSIDSDDELTPDALEIFCQNWRNIDESQVEIGLINARTIVAGDDDHPHPIFNGNDYVDDTYHNVAIKCGEQSEMITSIRVRDLEKILSIPEDFWLSDKVKFFAECVLWGRAGRYTKTRYLKNVLRVVHQDADNQVSHNKSRKGVSHLYNYIVGIKYFYSENLDYILKYRKKQLIIDLVKYNAMCMITRISMKEAFVQLQKTPLKILYLLSFPISVMAVLYFYIKRCI